MKTMIRIALVFLSLSACVVNKSIAWQDIRDSQEQAVYYGFITANPASPNVQQARAAIDSLDWNEAQKANNFEEYENYYFKHPNGKYSEAAKKLLTTEVDRVIASEVPGNYTQAWPDNPTLGAMYKEKTNKLKKQELEHYKQVVSANQLDKYKAFLAAWPGSKHYEDIAQRVKLKQDSIFEAAWKKLQDSSSIADYESFLSEYPDNKYQEQALTRLQVLREEFEKEQERQRLAEAEEKERQRLAEAEIAAQMAPYLKIEDLEQSIIDNVLNKGVGNRYAIKDYRLADFFGRFSMRSRGSSTEISIFGDYPNDEIMSPEGFVMHGRFSTFYLGPGPTYTRDASQTNRINTHRYEGTIETQDYIFRNTGDTLNRLTFAEINNMYVYIRGKGSVTEVKTGITKTFE